MDSIPSVHENPVIDFPAYRGSFQIYAVTPPPPDMNSSLPTQRPKRAGEDFLREQYNIEGGKQHSNKKAKFDYRNPSTLAPDVEDDDPILDLDEIGGRGAQVKRNAVELDGYESDSDNDNFDQRARDKARQQDRAQKSKDEDENDMFADLDENASGGGSDDEEVSKQGKKNKQVNFMEEGDIEGQVANSKSGGHVSADFSLKGKGKAARSKDQESSCESEEEVDEEERGMTAEGDDEEEMGAGSKKKHAPKVDAFNMKNEAEEGKFDETGNFIRNAADPFAVHDSWLEGSSKTAMKKAGEAHEKREEERRKRDIADDAVPTSQILAALIIRLQDEETVLEALARLNAAKEKKKPKFQKNRRKGGEDMDVDGADDEKEVKRKEAVEALTTAADQLLTRGQTDIYDAERALLMRQYKRETGEEWSEDAGSVNGAETKIRDKQFEYRWSDARDGGSSHGPYDGQTMQAWNAAGYFGEGVEFREVSGTDDWSRSAEFT